jgi:hypothetical protein
MSTTSNSAYSHPRLNELLQLAAGTPFIGQLLIGTVRDLIHPQDRILACYYQMETSGATAEREFTYYSVEVVLVTTAFFIRINFYPKTHTVIKKRIHMIADLKLEYPAPAMEALADLKTSEFMPSRVALAIHLLNDRGATAEHWNIESSELAHVRQLMELSRLLGGLVGVPLAQAGTKAAS